jgi:hypothetical protein
MIGDDAVQQRTDVVDPGAADHGLIELGDVAQVQVPDAAIVERHVPEEGRDPAVGSGRPELRQDIRAPRRNLADHHWIRCVLSGGADRVVDEACLVLDVELVEDALLEYR